MASFYVGKRRAKHGEIAAECRASSLRLNHASRSLHQSGASPRDGKHTRLSLEECNRRKADRAARRRKIQLQKETFAELAEQRAARKRVREEEAWLKRGTIRVKVAKEQRSKVTRDGGRRHNRQRQRFERAVLPDWSATRFSQTGLVWRIKSRSLGGNGPGRYRRRECSNFARYLINEIALELSPEEAIFTSIVPQQVARDSDAFARELVTFLDAAEDLEHEIDPAGQLYKSIIVPLPHDVGADRRREIAASYARQFDRHKLPYLLVLHAPDPGGDRRNYHLHGLVLTRAFERMGDHEWTFAKTKSRDMFHPSMLKVWRRYTVNLFNHHLAQSKIARRYTMRAAEPGGQHQGRVRTVEWRKRMVAAEDRVVEAERVRDRSSIVLGLADRLVAIARGQADIGRVIGGIQTGVLEQLKGNSVAVRDTIARQRTALQAEVLLADLRRRAMAIRARRDRIATLTRVATLRQDLATRATAVVAAAAHLAALSRGITVRRLLARMSELSERVRIASADLDAVARRVAQRTQIQRARRDLQGAAEAHAHNRAVLMDVARKAAEEVRARLRYIAERVVRSRIDMRTAQGTAISRQASSLRDSLAIAHMNVELAQLNLAKPPATGIMAQAARAVAAKGVPPTVGGSLQSAAIGPKAVVKTAPAPPKSFRGTLVEVDAFDAAIRVLPLRRASAIQADLNDLRAAMQANYVHLYRNDRGLRVLTDDCVVRAMVARIVADPAGKSILLALGGQIAKQPSPTLLPNEPALARYTPPTAVPSVVPGSPPTTAIPNVDAKREPTRHKTDLDHGAGDEQLPVQKGGTER